VSGCVDNESMFGRNFEQVLGVKVGDLQLLWFYDRCGCIYMHMHRIDRYEYICVYIMWSNVYTCTFLYCMYTHVCTVPTHIRSTTVILHEPLYELNIPE